ncbi:MAG: LptE family protein [bacterium]
MKIVFLIFLSMALTACGYRILEKPLSWPESIRLIYVETIRNQSMEPGLDTVFTDALIQEFWHWGTTVRIVNRDEAQAVLSGVIHEYAADQSLSFDRDHNIREYRLTIRADLYMEEISTGKTIWQEKDIVIQGDYQFFKDDLARTRTKEYQARQKAVRDLARRLLDQRFMGH